MTGSSRITKLLAQAVKPSDQLETVETPITTSDNRRVVGILGGMGPAASAYFCLRLAQSTAAMRDQDHLHVLLDSDASVPDRSAFLLGHGTDPLPALVAMARRLVAAGADLLVMACNSAAPFTPRVRQALGVEFVDWIGEAVSHIVKAYPDVALVGLLATDGTAQAALYQDRLAEAGVATATPAQDVQKLVSQAIDAVKAGTPCLARQRDGVLEAARWLVDEGGASVLLVACTEISLLFSNNEAEWPAPMIDTLDVVAARTVVRAGGQLRAHNPYS